MNVVTMNACVIGSPKEGATQTGTPKCTFVIETDGNELPLRFACICFGPCAERAIELKDRDKILITGKMTASAYSRSMTVTVSNLEILPANLAEKSGATK